MEKRLSGIIKTYNEVFDEKGNIKVCGRDKCQELIIQLEELRNLLNKYPSGNIKTGVLDVEGIKNIIS